MNPYGRLLVAVTLASAAGTAIYFSLHRSNPLSIAAPRSSDSVAQEGAAPKIQYPVDSAENPESKPKTVDRTESNPIDYGGKTFEIVLRDLIGNDLFNSIFILGDLARGIVVAVESATSSAQLPSEHSPLKPLDSDFIVAGKGKHLSISPDNFRRYARFAELAKTVDPKRLVAVYVHFYPAIQSAYRELGTNKYFNDRVVGVIDHLLKTPQVAGYPRLVRPGPNYKYKYAELELENLSSSQKVLIRMGFENAEIIKTKLRAIRELLVHLGKKKRK